MLSVALGLRAMAADWPQLLGPGRNGVYSGPALSETWGGTGPRVVWRRQIGKGLSGPVVVQNRVILFHRVANREVVEAIDAASGKTQWQYAYPTSYRDDFGFDEGPRAVPVVANGAVYTFGAEGQLHAVDLASGMKIWSEDTMRRFGVPKGFFGAAGSPLVEDGRSHRKHRRQKCRHRGVRREDRESALDGHRRWRELLVRDWRHDRRAPLRGVSDAQRARRARPRDRSGAIRAAVAGQAGRVGECGDAGRERRFDFHLG